MSSPIHPCAGATEPGFTAASLHHHRAPCAVTHTSSERALGPPALHRVRGTGRQTIPPGVFSTVMLVSNWPKRAVGQSQGIKVPGPGERGAWLERDVGLTDKCYGRQSSVSPPKPGSCSQGRQRPGCKEHSPGPRQKSEAPAPSKLGTAVQGCKHSHPGSPTCSRGLVMLQLSRDSNCEPGT